MDTRVASSLEVGYAEQWSLGVYVCLYMYVL
jgi:hypothetical protein